MRHHTKRNEPRMALKIISIVILIAICASIAFGVDVLWNKIDESNYPQEYSEYVTEYSIKYNIPEYIIYAVIKVEINIVNEVLESNDKGLRFVSVKCGESVE